MEDLGDQVHADIHALFVYYNEIYFTNCLGACSVEVCTRMMKTFAVEKITTTVPHLNRPSHSSNVSIVSPVPSLHNNYTVVQQTYDRMWRHMRI